MRRVAKAVLALALAVAVAGVDAQRPGAEPGSAPTDKQTSPAGPSALSPDFQQAVLFATNSIWLQEGSVVVSGNIIVNDASPGPTLNSGVELSVAQGVVTAVDSVLKADSIKVAKDAAIGAVVSNELDNRGAIASEATPLSLPVIAAVDLPPFESGMPGSDDVRVPKDTTVVLPEGDYRDIVIEKNGTLIFGESGSPLTYNVASIRGKLESKLLFPAPTRVRVAQTVDVDKDSIIAPAMMFSASFEAADEADASGADVIFFVAGVQGVNGAEIGQHVRVAANFYVPEGGLFLHNGTHAVGGFFARDVRVGRGAVVQLANFFANASPTDILLDNAAVDEGLPIGALVGNLTTVDPDPGDVHSYALVAGPGDDDNALFAIDGDQLRTAVVFSVNGNSAFSVRIQTDDGSGGTFEKAFTITVIDASGPPTDILLDNTEVDENQPAGTLVGTFTSIDPDPGDVHTYALVAGAGDSGNGAFVIAGDQLLTAAQLDFETQASYSIRVQSDDGTSGTFEKVFTIDVRDRNDPPLAGDDSYDGAIGNTRLTLVESPSPGTSVPPTVELVASVLDNDVDGDVPADDLATTANPAIPTVEGGTVSMDADGRFVYDPPAGFTGGSDSFDYEVCDDGIAPPGPLCAVGTVTIAIQDIVWYVDDSAAAAGSGTAADPFQELASAGAASAPGEKIFVYEGTQATGIALQSGQELIGQGLDLIVGGTTLVDAAARPEIANAAGAAVLLGADNTVRGLDISGSRDGLVGSAFGTLTVNEVSIATIGGPALELTAGVASVTLDSLASSGSSGLGVDLESVGGNLDLGGGAIAGAAGDAFAIVDSTAVVNYAGTIDAITGRPVLVSGQSAGILTFAGAIGSTGLGVSLSNNGGATINFEGGLTLATGTAAALSATGGGTLNITGINTIDTGGGIGLNVVATDIGASGLTFESISVNGASNGIVLNDTGTMGGLTVTGTGAADSGGIIQNTTGVGISLNSVSGISLTRMRISETGDDGIGGSNVTNLIFDNGTIINAGTPGVTNENGIDISGLFGTMNAINDSSITRSAEFNVRIENSTATNAAPGTPDMLTVSNSSLGDNEFSGSGADGIFFGGINTANMKLDVTGMTCTDCRTDGVQADAGNTATVEFDLTASTFTSNNIGLNITSSQTARMNYDVNANLSFTAHTSNIINVAHGVGNGDVDGQIVDNPIIDGSVMGNGVRVIMEGAGAAGPIAATLIDNNVISDFNNPFGVHAVARAGTAAHHVTIEDNMVIQANPTSFADDAVRVESGNGTAGEANVVCLDIETLAADGGGGTNTASSPFGDGYEVQQRSGTTFQLEGLADSDCSGVPCNGTSDVQVEEHITDNNAGTANVRTASRIVNYTHVDSCPAPLLLP